MRGQRPDLEDQIRRDASARALGTAEVEPEKTLTVLLSNGTVLPAEIKKFSAPLLTDVTGKPMPTPGATWRCCACRTATIPPSACRRARGRSATRCTSSASPAWCSPTSS